MIPTLETERLLLRGFQMDDVRRPTAPRIHRTAASTSPTLRIDQWTLPEGRQRSGRGLSRSVASLLKPW